jgi:hypothetical protein
MNIAGTWKKASAEQCAEKYPDEIEFEERPRFLARKGPNQRFIWWDVGGYEIIGNDRVKISTATDEQVTYTVKLEGHRLEFTDDEGCTFAYLRVNRTQ